MSHRCWHGGVLGIGQAVTFTLNLSSAVTVAGGVPTLLLNDGGTASYMGGTGTKSLTFSYTIGSGDNTADLQVTGFALNGATVGGGSINFAAPASYNVGSSPTSFTTADLNGDGNQDLIVADGNGISVLMGNGNGGFGPATNYATGAHPVSVTLADVNGDGKLDAIVADNGNFAGNPGFISVLLGDGKGGFGPATNYAAGPNPAGVTTGDVNGDGKPDVVVADSGGDGAVSVLLGDGDGGFLSTTTYTNGFYGGPRAPSAVVVSDLNGDGNQDLIVLTYGNAVSVMLGNGSGDFGSVTNFPTGSGPIPRSLATADLNGDGNLDLVIGSYQWYIYVLFGNGHGGFSAGTVYTQGTNFVGLQSVAVADVNGDGNPDILIATGDDNVLVRLGDGDGGFGAPTSYASGANATSITAADLNNDGKPDLIVADSSGSVSVLLNSTTISSFDGTSVATAPGHDTELAISTTPPPTLLTLAEISKAVYDQYDHAFPIEGYQQLLTAGTSGLIGQAYRSGNQIVIVFRGTDPNEWKNILADKSFATGVPTTTFKNYVIQAGQFLRNIQGANPGAVLTLTGHSLGGAIAQLLGDAYGLRTISFNAPGPAELEPALIADGDLASPSGIKGDITNFRIYGDQASLIGTQLGETTTIASPYKDAVSNAYANHDINTIIDQLVSQASTQTGLPPDVPLPEAGIVVSAANAYVSLVTFSSGSPGQLCAIDPAGAASYQLIGDEGTPQLVSFTLPTLPGVFGYNVSLDRSATWTPSQVVQPGVLITQSMPFDGLQFEALDGADQPVGIASPILFTVGFANAGLFTGTLTATPGPSGNTFNWNTGAGDFGAGMNWTDNSDTTPGPPGPIDEADFSTPNGGAITGLGSVHALIFDGTGSWSVAGTLAVGSEVVVGPSAVNTTTMAVTSGGAIICSGVVDIGSDATGAGVVLLNTGILRSAGGMTIGGSGLGVVTIEAGGELLSGGTILIGDGSTGTGNIEIQDGGPFLSAGPHLVGSASITLGVSAGSSANVNVNGLGSIIDTGGDPLAIGSFGNGTLSVGNGASVLAATQYATDAAVNLGANAGGTGALYISDPGSSFIAVGQLNVGQSGTGHLRVENQATLQTGDSAPVDPSQGFDVAGASGGMGDVTVSGAKSLLTNTGRFIVGGSGQGSLSIESGGTVVTNPGTVDGLTGLVIANTASASGSSVNVNGIGSELGVTGLLDVGAAGSGALQLSGGAVVTAGSLDAGNVATAVANIDLSGIGTELSVMGGATLADDGSGVLSILSGATFSATSLTIGSQGHSSGAVVVSGSGSVVNLSGALNVGTSLGTGDLTVGPGAAVHAAVVNLEGQVVLEGGLLDPTINVINQGQTAAGFGTIAAGDIVDEGVIQAGGTKPSQRLLVVQGTVLGGGALTANGTVQGSNPTGMLQINPAGTLELAGSVINTATTTFTDNLTPTETYTVNNSVVDVTFADSAGVLLLDDIAGFGGTISAYQVGDSFVIAGGTLSNLGVSNSTTLTVSDSGTGAGPGGIDQIFFRSAVKAGGFNIVNGNTVQVACFAAGTRIETVTGPLAVEALRVGDRLVTEGGLGEPIVWLGQRAVDCLAHPKPEAVWPVRVGAGAFGANVPGRDLYLSPDHAVFVNGVLIPVKLLIDGAAIAQVPRDCVTYFHVELPHHAVILAEGLPVESYLDTGDRAKFVDATVTTRHSNFAVWTWEMEGCAMLVVTGPTLNKTRRWLESLVEHRITRSSAAA
jgi:T5SS/PEP-CTERM-associated repeat protein